MTHQETLNERPQLSRTDIINALNDELAKKDYVQAFWEGGAAAWNRVDEWSDIDAYLLVDHGKVQETFNDVEKVLASLSPIDQKFAVTRNAWPGLSQAFYRLERASPFLVLDIAIMTDSSPEKYLEPEIHGKSVFYFNKQEIDETPAVDRKAFEKKHRDDMEYIKERVRMFGDYVEKEIKRGNSLEALEYYRTIIIPSLVQVLRAKYTPMHYDFRMRYIHRELPNDIVRRLEDLCFVSGLKDLEKKNAEAVQWFNKLSP